ncbi:MAG: hypothetical protein GYB41_12415 [Oceanospirillales bacterium]|uniref:Uncharacterized protein n=1 Tax=Marinobacterium halophilum TaxID=267374 RepID=A0A2P8F4V8_9GAMM|nr:hypothetical protein [Oceanospirillales bacterium]PSL16740.1 hypothetical protein CLV44_101138 [Marinobacterium halophilum]
MLIIGAIGFIRVYPSFFLSASESVYDQGYELPLAAIVLKQNKRFMFSTESEKEQWHDEL